MTIEQDYLCSIETAWQNWAEHNHLLSVMDAGTYWVSIHREDESYVVLKMFKRSGLSADMAYRDTTEKAVALAMQWVAERRTR